MILTYNQEHSRLIKRLFRTAMSSTDDLLTIQNFITKLEQYIDHHKLCSEEEYPFTIIGQDSLNLSPLGIDTNALISFCNKIRDNQGNLEATFSNYLKALGNYPLLDTVNDTDATNASFIIDTYMQNPLHMNILIANDPKELLYELQTPDEVITLIQDPNGLYYNLLNLDSDKEEIDSYSSEEDYNYSDL